MSVIYFRFSAITNYFSTHRLLSITPLVFQALRLLIFSLNRPLLVFCVEFLYFYVQLENFTIIFVSFWISAHFFSSSTRMPVAPTGENYYVRFNGCTTYKTSVFLSLTFTRFVSFIVAISFFLYLHLFHLCVRVLFTCLSACLPACLYRFLVTHCMLIIHK